jgi:hypothetical protein
MLYVQCVVKNPHLKWCSDHVVSKNIHIYGNQVIWFEPIYKSLSLQYIRCVGVDTKPLPTNFQGRWIGARAGACDLAFPGNPHKTNLKFSTTDRKLLPENC